MHWLEAELAKQPALQPLYDSRALERIAKDTEAIRWALEEALAEAQKYERVVQVGGSLDRSIVVTGDRNVVTQLFQTYFVGDYVPLSDLYLSPDAVFQRVRLDDFVGREWLEADLDRFLSEHDCGVWLLVGEAGVGKTTFLAHLVRDRRYLHFFAEQAPGEAGVTRALQSLAAQLVARYRLEPYASRDALSPAQAAYPDFLERLLRRAAERLTAGERLIIVADALDEAGLGPNHNVLGLPKVLPKGVFLILSQRPVATVPLHVDPYPERVDLRAGDARNLADVETYLRGVACHPAVAGQLRARHYAEADFVRVLQEKSAGNWMYLSFVVREIREGKRHPLDLEQLPVRLAGYYGEYWRRWRQKPKWDQRYAPLLAALAAAREPVSLEMLARWTGLRADYGLQRLLKEEWAAFLYQVDARFRLYHASLRDFLTGKMISERLVVADERLVEEMAERTRDTHRRIADDYWQAAGDWRRLAEVDGGYGLRHLGAHLAGAGEWERLHELVAAGEERQPWAEARHGAEGNYEGYLADLALAWRRAEEEGARAPTAVGRQVRYALIEASFHSLAGNIPPPLLIALVENRFWAPTAALAYARQMPDEDQRVEALAGLAPHLPESLLPEALAAAREIRDANVRAEALVWLAPHLPENLREQALQEALAAARKIERESTRSQILVGLAPHLPESLLPEAVTAAREIRDADDRARALAGLAPRLAALPRPAFYPLWTEALPALARRTRRDLLSDLRALEPVIPALGGEPAVVETFRAIREVGRWWP